MNSRVCVLSSGDESKLETFLASHRDSSMFLRANAQRAGLVDRGEPFQATYAAAVEDGRVIGVAAHGWNGTLLMQAPVQAGDLARAAVAGSGRRVTGLMGPLAHVREARSALGLDTADASVEGSEWLYALDVSGFVVPAVASNPAIVCRPPLADERDLLCAWRIAYDIEVLGAVDSPESRRRSAEFLDRQIAGGNAWIALDDGVPISLSGFNATLPDIVQLGGIYTPPALRGRGYAKVVVAASLVAARDRGASRAVLFTNSPSACRTYEALGFQLVGDYSLVFLR